MPEVTLTLDQVVAAVMRLTPAERAEFLRRVQEDEPPRISRDIWLAELREIRKMLTKVPGSFSDIIIEDREDRI